VYTHSYINRHVAGAEFSMFDPRKFAFWRGDRLRNGHTMVQWCGQLQPKKIGPLVHKDAQLGLAVPEPFLHQKTPRIAVSPPKTPKIAENG
jgi:hypothetical protein